MTEILLSRLSRDRPSESAVQRVLKSSGNPGYHHMRNEFRDVILWVPSWWPVMASVSTDEIGLYRGNHVCLYTSRTVIGCPRSDPTPAFMVSRSRYGAALALNQRGLDDISLLMHHFTARHTLVRMHTKHKQSKTLWMM